MPSIRSSRRGRPFTRPGLLCLFLAAFMLAACSTVPKVKTAPGAAPAEIGEEARTRYQQALALMQAGKDEEAVAVLQQMTRDYPRLAGPYVNLGILYSRSGRSEEAAQALRKAIALRPDNAAAHNALGILYREQGRFDEARAAYEAALKADPKYAYAHLNLGILLDIYLQRPAEALPHYEAYQALQARPDKTVALWIVDLKRRLEKKP